MKHLRAFLALLIAAALLGADGAEASRYLPVTSSPKALSVPVAKLLNATDTGTVSAQKYRLIDPKTFLSLAANSNASDTGGTPALCVDRRSNPAGRVLASAMEDACRRKLASWGFERVDECNLEKTKIFTPDFHRCDLLSDFDGFIPGGQTSLFQGLWTDPVTGLSYARNRWYDARTASWLSEDPAGAFDSENLYSFVGWQPHMYADPTGEVAFLPFVVWGLAAYFAIDEGIKEIEYQTTVDPHADMGSAFLQGFGRGVAIEGVSTALGGGVGKLALKSLIMKGGFRTAAGMGLSGGAAGFGATLGKDLYNVGMLGRDWSSPGEYALSTTFGAGMGFAAGGVIGSRMSAPGRATPASYGVETIAERSEWLDIYNASLRRVAKGNNAYTAYLKAGANVSKEEANAAWNAVSKEFLKRMRAAGYDISETHHWNWTRSAYPEHVFDPRHLVPIPRNRPGLHDTIHFDLTSHPNPEAHILFKFIGGIKPEHQIPLGPARSVLTPGG